MQVGEQCGVGSVEAVDGLVRVSDAEQGGVWRHESLDQQELHRADVLELVDQHMTGPPVDGLGEGRVAQCLGGVDDQVVEVEHPRAALSLLVATPELGDDLGWERGPPARSARPVLVGPRLKSVPLSPGDLGVERGRGGSGHRAPDGLEHARQAPTTIGEDAGRPEALLGASHLEQLERGGVKGSRSDPLDVEPPQPVAELLGGTAGEGDHQQVVRIDAGRHHLPDAQRQHRGLPRAGSGEDREAGVTGGDGLALDWGQPGELVVCSTIEVHGANRSQSA